MDIRRITEIGAAGAAQANSSTSKRVGAVQQRANGGIQLPRVSVYRKAAQSVATATLTGIDFDFEEFDTHGLHTTATTSDFLVSASAAGVWSVSMSMQWAANTTGSREILAILNPGSIASLIPQSQNFLLASANNSTGDGRLQSNFIVSLQEGDTIRAYVRQYSGANRNLTFASFQAFRIGV